MTKALTLHQPWASLIAVGAKTIETRSWPTKHRGRLLIHAGKARPVSVGGWTVATLEGKFGGSGAYLYDPQDEFVGPLPLGAVVASCTLADCVPILRAGQDPCPDGDEWVRHVAPSRPLGDLLLWEGPTRVENLSTGRLGWRTVNVEDQRPFGDFSPGRWAWLLEDVKSTTERCPACWGESPRHCHVLIGPTFGYCAFEWGHEGEHLDDSEAAYGYRLPAFCPVCDGAGKCDPIPARGRQGLWTWEPDMT